MSKVDFSLAGNYLNSSEDMSCLEGFLMDEDGSTKRCMNSAMIALYGRVNKALDIKKDIYKELSNINKFYLVRGAFPEHDQEIRAFILERFYKFTS